MPKKISLVEKRTWLDSYESGKSVESIATGAHRDVRTIKKGMDEARHEVDARTARAELLKEALRKHQSSLMGVLDEISSTIVFPPGDSPILPWYTSSFTQKAGTAEAIPGDALLFVQSKVAGGLLREHLKHDPLWKILADWPKAAAAYVDAKKAFQRKTVALLEEKTGYKVVDYSQTVAPPFVSMETAPQLLFEVASRRVLKMPERDDLEANTIADAVTGEVRYYSSVLAKAPGKEEKCKRALSAALKELQASPEAARLASTYKAVCELQSKTSKAVEEISLLGLIPGQCRICRRLGM